LVDAVQLRLERERKEAKAANLALKKPPAYREFSKAKEDAQCHSCGSPLLRPLVAD
jgi:hypothetical protein